MPAGPVPMFNTSLSGLTRTTLRKKMPRIMNPRQINHVPYGCCVLKKARPNKQKNSPNPNLNTRTAFLRDVS
jgi:hypothetical protein